MPVFKIAWTELYGFEALVEADNLEKAIILLKSDLGLFANLSEALYVDDSLEINREFTEEMNDKNGVKDEFR